MVGVVERNVVDVENDFAGHRAVFAEFFGERPCVDAANAGHLPLFEPITKALFRIPMEMNLWQIKIPLYIELSFNVTVYIFRLNLL